MQAKFSCDFFLSESLCLVLRRRSSCCVTCCCFTAPPRSAPPLPSPRWSTYPPTRCAPTWPVSSWTTSSVTWMTPSTTVNIHCSASSVGVSDEVNPRWLLLFLFWIFFKSCVLSVGLKTYCSLSPCATQVRLRMSRRRRSLSSRGSATTSLATAS